MSELNQSTGIPKVAGLSLSTIGGGSLLSPVALELVGFTAAGVAGGSIAAIVQSIYFGAAVPAEYLFALAQLAGATGILLNPTTFITEVGVITILIVNGIEKGYISTEMIENVVISMKEKLGEGEVRLQKLGEMFWRDLKTWGDDWGKKNEENFRELWEHLEDSKSVGQSWTALNKWGERNADQVFAAVRGIEGVWISFTRRLGDGKAVSNSEDSDVNV